MISLVVTSFISFSLGYFIGCALCHRNARRRRSGYLRYEVPDNKEVDLGKRVKVIDKITGEVKYEGTVSPIEQMSDSTRVDLEGGGSRIYYWTNDTESIEYID